MRKTLAAAALAAGVAFSSPLLAAPAHAATPTAAVSANVHAAYNNNGSSDNKSGRWGLLGLLGLPGLFGYKKYREIRATRSTGGVGTDGSTSPRN